MAVVKTSFAGRAKRPLLVDTAALVSTISVRTAGRLGLDLEWPSRWQYLISHQRWVRRRK